MIPHQQVQSKISHNNRIQPCASDPIWDTAAAKYEHTMAYTYYSSQISVGSLVKQLKDIDDTTQKA